MVELIDGLLWALAGLPLWALAAAVAIVMALEASLLTGMVVPGDLVGAVRGLHSDHPDPICGPVDGGRRRLGGRGDDRLRHRPPVRPARAGEPHRPLAGPAAMGERRRVPPTAGARTVVAGRFLAAVHAVLPIVAGTVRMSYRRFLTAAVAGALAWSALYMVIGALAGASYRAVAEQLSRSPASSRVD
jgi:membrane-associated protein